MCSVDDVFESSLFLHIRLHLPLPDSLTVPFDDIAGMAEGKANDEEVQETCSVCLESFTEPKVLPCCHTFCLRCLETTVDTASGADDKTPRIPAEITCPQCRKTHAIPSNGVKGFLTDFVALHEMEVGGLKPFKSSAGTLRSLKRALPRDCGECRVEGALVSFCAKCRSYLCSECSSQAHKKYKAYDGHKVVLVDEIHYCSVHEVEIVSLFCNDDVCKKYICRDCALSEHRQHEYIPLHGKRQKISDSLALLMKEGKEKLDMFENNLQQIKNAETRADAYIKVLKNEVDTFLNALIQSIETQGQEIYTKVETECQNDLEQIRKDKAFHEATIPQMEAALKLAEKANRCTSESGNDVEVISTAQQSIGFLEELKKINWKVEAFATTVSCPAVFEKVKRLEEQAENIIRPQPMPKFKVQHRPWNCYAGESVSFQVLPEPLIDGRSQKQCFLHYDKEDVKSIKIKIKQQHSRQNDYSGFAHLRRARDGTYEVTLSPNTYGNYNISITYNGQNIEGSPFDLRVENKPARRQ